MIVRLAFQVVVLVVVSGVAAFVANGLRSGGIEWRGGDPERFRYPGVEFISIEDAAVLHEDLSTLFLDARSPRDFETRHVFAAVSFPADDVEAAYEELRDFLDPQMNLVVYSTETLVAVRAARFLGERGFRASVLDGGWEEWRGRRLPVEGGSP
ncbi:MAG: rhodanese-like domain-containing protein [Candidatus Krumholzibacteriia bacterium]